jgi:hypothetical protein
MPLPSIKAEFNHLKTRKAGQHVETLMLFEMIFLHRNKYRMLALRA